MSPDIWVVPGTDPDGAAGTPVVGEPAFVWARVHNRGSTSVPDATVRFYWADPSSAINRASAHAIGTSGAAIEAGDVQDVLCLTPWIPSSATSPHVCLLVEAYAPADPLPPHTTLTPFDPPGDRHVAQRNINLLQVSPKMKLVFLPFLAGGATRRGDTRVVARRVPLETIDRGLLERLGVREANDADGEFRVTIGHYRRGVDPEPFETDEIRVRGPRQQELAIAVELGGQLREGSALVVVAEEVSDKDEVLGGVSAVILGSPQVEGSDQKEVAR